MATVEFKQVHKTYPGAHIVKGIDLKIESGEFLVLLGPSGCGKSTTLRMIAGLEDISEGCIEIDQQVVNDLEPKERNIAMVFQSYALYPHLSVYKNIGFGLRLAKVDKQIIDSKVRDVAELLELTPLLDRKPKDLSGGQRQRVAMGRAMVRTPNVFLFDEPLSNLDAKLRHTMRAEIRQLHDQLKKTTVYVTHDQVEAMTLADRVVIMHEGHIAQIGKPRDVFLHPQSKFVAGFIGSPTMNFLKGDVRIDDSSNYWLNFAGNDVQLDQSYSGNVGEVDLGIRPSDIYLSPKTCSHNNPLHEFEANIDSYELLGATALIVVSRGEQSFKVEVSANYALESGQAMTLHIDLSQLHIFDTQSGAAVYRVIN
ncbi:sn-glycerol-3-phosphate ABC transporter ATP-binding protein UgpC [Alginatibacterium sediminis]|uniref:sn-glycerol-3-phosphate ABC transporter ATP-binding protein UgpC n=1 Tax=Alginatibacterium sediminis TaxID=2164068 RepID=A0A420EGJ5_9ALTE|nr:sn-glycerol-3-phosphate ABC transporter ATP-binding protein UgpC [Alginatibacterium sediminis]RKF19793.1 sn-glycerol-3-phosphate ABC transporter ATP-binding protein UgpC [Alginatibacterium sediminis]